MPCARSLGRAEAGDPSLKLGSSSSTYSFSTYLFKGDLGEVSKISGGWIEKFIGGLEATIEGIYDSFEKSSKTEKVNRKECK